METVSGRIPDDLYQWFASLRVEGAITSSDKLRELLAQMKRQHDGSLDLVSAQSWFRDVLTPFRTELGALERDEGLQSEVVNVIVEHVAALVAVLLSAHPIDKKEAVTVEDILVRRVFGLTESMLRQAVTPRAAGFDPGVVRRYSKQAVELAKLVS
jgi:hypothetical protein